MGIPQNISKEHIEKAIIEIIPEQIPAQRHEKKYLLITDEKVLPPKYVISIANKYANGEELNSDDFNAIEAKQFLLKHNFRVVDKKFETESYYVLGAVWTDNEKSSDQSERFIQNEIWENGYDDKFLDVVKSVNAGDRVAIKSSYATKEGKSILRVKARGTVYENPGDGRTLKINWDKSFEPFDLEGFGGYRNTIQKVSDKDINSIFKFKTNMSYYLELKKFITQAKTDELKTSQYLKSFSDLEVKVSFGQGYQSRVPWIAFLNGVDNVQQGIYPVYLFYKEKEKIILAYGVSETHPSNRRWNITNEKTIHQYFADNGLGKPERYGNSYVFKCYDSNIDLSEKEINDDLERLITIYKSNSDNSNPSLKLNKTFLYTYFIQAISEAGLFFNNKTILQFVSSLITKPFVILTGLSGSGKTKLAQAFAMWICENNNQYCIVPVGADWTNREPLLGFPNALDKKSYIFPDNCTLNLIIEASKAENKNKPYFLILDEMNLSHVERYFADFLSVMESKDKKGILLHSDNERKDSNGNIVPNNIKFPKNLFIIGTVNIDETTYMFSPKVLDRANVIEFRVTKEEMGNYLESNASLKLENLESLGVSMAASFIQIAKDDMLQPENTSELNTTLMNFFNELKKTGAEFGYRSASEILRFTAVVNKIEPSWTLTDIIDAAIMQKLLPKVHGSRRKLAPVLETLGAICLNEKIKEEEKMENYLNPKDSKDFSTQIKYPLSFEKISRMYKGLLDNGFTSYAEA